MKSFTDVLWRAKVREIMNEEKLKSILKETFGHSEFRFDQLQIINSVIEGKDVLAIMPTGGGKSMCYQIPGLFNLGITLIISPLISLMQDQVINLNQNGVEACFLNSSLEYQEKQKIQQKILNGEVKLVYVSPEGLISGSLKDFFINLEISLIAVDEAHCVSQWGHEFRKDYTKLGELKDIFPNTPFLALTATADARTREDIITQLRLKNPNVFVSSFDRPNIKYKICERNHEIRQLDQFISKNHNNDTGIVYCLSRRKVEKVTLELNKLGYHSVAYHAGLTPKVRQEAQELFNSEDKIIVVATIAFGMGIDRPDVRFVAHLDLPKSIESYYQETGRAGRDGLPANAWMVYGLQDVIKLSQMLETTDASDSYKKNARIKLDSMLSLCETTTCRRQFLLDYFEEKADDTCNNCDSCLEPGEKWDATVDAQKVLSTIFKTGQFFGAGYIVDVLRGSKNSKLIERGHHKTTVYGIGKDKSKIHWNIIIRQLLNMKYIAVKNWEYRNFYLTSKSRELLNGEALLELRQIKDQTSPKAKRIKAVNVVSTHDRHDLFESLRGLRKELADQNKVPPYVIFADKSLHDMCQLMPRDRFEFLMVNGVGQSKCDKYSSPFLKIINGY